MTRIVLVMREFEKDLEYFVRLDQNRLTQMDNDTKRRFARMYEYARRNFTGFWDSPPDRGSIQDKMAFIMKAKRAM